MTPTPSKILKILCVLYLALAPAALAGTKEAKQAEAQLRFGVDMARRGLWSEALFRFQQADQLDPRNPRILNNLAVAYEATGEFEQADALYRRALELAPGDRELRRNFTRFIEFYQSYKPEGEGQAAAAEGEEAAEPTPQGQGGG